MLSVYEIKLQDTRFYQEIAEEERKVGKQEECVSLLSRLLRRKFGVQPQPKPKPGLVVHSDRGSQYASKDYQDLLNQYGLIGSMSRKGNCWDNSVMERFFLNLKMERVWRQNYANNEEAKMNITDYIINFYNSRRLHSTLGYVSPNAYEVKTP